MSRRPLTGYDNRDAASGEPAEEVYRYDALTDTLSCVSCNPSGARPRGVVEGDAYDLPTDPHAIWRGRQLAALLPATSFTQEVTEGPVYQPRRVLDDGRVYFTAFDSLVPADSNGTADAYQYEPHGAGGCTPASSGASSAQALGGGGCVSLLSAGTSGSESALLDVSASGNDAFIYTASPLSALDEDPDYDIYDARVGGVPAERELRPECLGEACQPAASAPEDPTPASAAFRGPGNVREGSAGRCARSARKAKRLSGRAKRLRRTAKQARRNGRSALARRRARKATHLAKRARQTSKRAKRCRARASKRKGGAKNSALQPSRARHNRRSRR